MEEVLGVISLGSTSNPLIDFETTNDITIKLVTGKMPRTIELLVKIEPDDDQDFQLSVDTSFSS
ncbi:9828_t:CDS:2 [Cetraspora pellucida]|uniref:9828_t:CDS:1 n=1 Tax=Cetraspora pellucida TaxID=1433469 RepID=A0A9N8VWV5_9GLOM|nr:9828_t:CDS:2 [Cetraspora pellucida]